MSLRIPVKFLSIGTLHREFIIDLPGNSHEDIIGGPCLYAAGVMNYWADHVGVAGLIGEDYPPSWQSELTRQKIDHRGILQLKGFPDTRIFHAYPTPPVNRMETPVVVYAARNLIYPKSLLGYSSLKAEEQREKISDFTQRLVNHLPPDYLNATAAHVSSMDLNSQVQLTTWLLKGSIRMVSVHSHPSYMLSTFYDDIPMAVKDTSLFLTTLPELRQLFQGRSSDVWEMMACICDLGCSTVTVRTDNGQWMFFDSQKPGRYIIPDYPSRQLDPTGSADAFCGGFLVHYEQSRDPLHAALMGVIAVSLNAEGTGPFAIQHSTPGLDLKRYQMLQNLVIRV